MTAELLQNFIDGSFVAATATGVIDIINPAAETAQQQIQLGGPARLRFHALP